MCDLDHFKKINDRHGHAVGDMVLKHFAAILRKALRKHDTVGRVGGEEFAIVLANAGIAEAEIFARRVNEQLKATPLIVNDKEVRMTASIGITCMKIDDSGADSSLSRSDMALYCAKKKGRNRIEIDSECDQGCGKK
jgi:diguanylate cyclase (GGDEF)-like protein